MFPERFVKRKVKTARVKVTAILPVRFAAAGNKPNILPNKIKKNNVNMYGRYFS